MVIDIGLNYFLILKLEKVITLKSKQHIIIFSIIVIIALLIFIVFFGNISKPLTLFNSKTAETRYEKVIRNINGNTNYTIELDIECITNEEKNFEIIVEERNKYQDYEDAKSVKLGSYTGKETIEITTKANTSELHIIFSANNVSERTKLTIKEVKINGKKEILNYKYLPTKLVNKIKNLDFQNKSVWERVSFYTDVVQLIKENGFCGIGGDCWKYRYTEHQDYSFISTEVHSYPLQVFLEFGILGIVAYIGIIVFIIKKTAQFNLNKEKSRIGITCALVCMVLHSCFDYDMSFMYVATMFFSLIAIINNDKGKKINTKKTNIINYGLIVLTAGIILNNIIYFIYQVNQENISNLDRKKQESIYNYFSKLIPYNKTIRIQNISYSSNYVEQYKYLLDNEPYYLSEDDSFYIYVMYEFVYQAIEENRLENIESLFEFFEKTKLTKKFYPRYQINRLSTILTLGEYINEFEKTNNQEELETMRKRAYTMVIDEIEQKKDSILDYKKGRYPETNVEFYKRDLQSIYEQALKHLT